MQIRQGARQSARQSFIFCACNARKYLFAQPLTGGIEKSELLSTKKTENHPISSSYGMTVITHYKSPPV